MKKIFNFLKTDVKIVNSYLLVIIVAIVLVTVGLFSYAIFVYDRTSSNIITLSVGEKGRICYNNGAYSAADPDVGNNWIRDDSTAITSPVKYSTTDPTAEGVTIISQGTKYRTREATTSYGDWSNYTTTSCDTTNEDECRTANIYRTRTSTAIGGRWTAGYVPTNSYGYYNDGNSQPYCTGWSSGTTTVSNTCQTTSAPSCSSSGTSYVSSCTAAYKVYCGTSTTTSYSTATECETFCSSGTCLVVLGTGYSCYKTSYAWQTGSTCSEGTNNTSSATCPTNYTKIGSGSSAYCRAFNKVTKTRSYYASTYKFYKYNSNWSAYTTTACVEDGCGGTNGNCCDGPTAGYSTRTPSTDYTDWSAWSTTSCGAESDTCDSEYIYEYTETVYKWCKWGSDIEYTGSPVEFEVPKTGYYKVELVGGDGGKCIVNGSVNGENARGGYTSGYIYLTKGEILYVYVGGMGTPGVVGVGSTGGWNGGGSGTWDGKDDEVSGGGGGATDIRCFYNSVTGKCEANTSNLAWNDDLGLNLRIMVAAGAGGKSYAYSGGDAYGLDGYTNYTVAAPGKQTSGYAFGIGKNGVGVADSDGVAGGGGGYYGGNSSNTSAQSAGASGSSYISGFGGVDSIDEQAIPGGTRTHNHNTLHYTGKYFINGAMIAGPNAGNGSASIYYVAANMPKTKTTLNDVRYIKDCIGDRIGSSCTNCRNWVSIQAIVNGENIALSPNASISSTIPTGGWYNSGNINSVIDGYFGGADLGGVVSTAYTGIQCVTVDLGVNPDSDDGLWDLDEVFVRHYANPEFSFNNHTLSVGSTLNSGTTSLSTVLIDNESNVNEAYGGKRVSAYD